LIENDAGHGRVMLLTSSIDRDLTDLPIRPAFVPLVRRMVLELGNALSKPDTRRTTVGQTRLIRIAQGTTRLVVTSPDGHEVEWSQADIGTHEEIAFTHTEVPGHYAVKAAFAGPLAALDGESFSVNIDTRESDLRPITSDEALAVLLGASTAAHAESTALARAQALKGFGNPEVVAGLLLLFMLAAFLLESVLTAQRIGR
jgi:hypothetical protein